MWVEFRPGAIMSTVIGVEFCPDGVLSGWNYVYCNEGGVLS